MTRIDSDRNLLFGVLALQMDFIPRDALIAAMSAWAVNKDKSLGEILQEQGTLAADRRALLEALVQEHLKLHDHDAAKSLASVRSIGSTRDELSQLADADLQASLAHVSTTHTDEDPYLTREPSGSAPTSAGVRFRILRPHARGGLGEVFVAHDEELHREVALKEIQGCHADNPDSRARFLQEAEITGGLEHPGIVPVYGLGTYADGRPFYAMRFIQGDSLKDAIERFHQADVRGRDPGERTLELRKLLGRFIDVCNAIAYAHSRGVLHRDLKPGNVMLGKYGETLVVDWGLAKPLGRPEIATETAERPLQPASANGSALTQMGAAIGTPAYMSPEQAAGRLDLLGPPSDVYSLGATLYCLLTGQAPLTDADAGQVLQKVERGEFPSPRQIQHQVPLALEAVCLKAMALRPEDRYPSPRALADDIEHWMADEPISACREPLSLRLSRWGRRHRPAVAAATTLLVVALVGCTAVLYENFHAYLGEREAQRQWAGHPEFQCLRTSQSDPGRLKFNHQVHLTPGLAVVEGEMPFTFEKIGDEAERKRYWQLLGGTGDVNLQAPVRLDCASCHRLYSSEFGIKPEQLSGLPLNSILPAYSSGNYMLPITYEVQCRACHPLTLAEHKDPADPRASPVLVRHRLQPQEVREFLESYFSAQLLGGKTQAPALVPKPPQDKLSDERADPLQLILAKVETAERFLYADNTCVKCHQTELGDGFMPRQILRTAIPQVWFPNALFNHAAHDTVSCRECHSGASHSTTANDVLVPGIDTCRKCHAPARQGSVQMVGADFKCSECHTENMLFHLQKTAKTGAR